MKFRLIIAALALTFLGACASRHKDPHAGMRGSVVMIMDAKTVHVCLGNDEVKVGDRVSFVRHECVSKRRGGKVADRSVDVVCTPKDLGTGTVSKLLNEHYSVVQPDQDAKVKEGDMVKVANP